MSVRGSPQFKVGDYIVLLTSCDGKDNWSHSIPINHCYKLREDYKTNQIGVLKDTNGSSNGWYISEDSNSFTSGEYAKMTARAATQEEIDKYNQLGKPFKVEEVNKEYYQIY